MRNRFPHDDRGVPLTATVFTERLAVSHSPYDVLRLLQDTERPVALCGAWAGGGALIASEPAAVADPAEDPFEVVDRQPLLVGSASPRLGTVGGGWFGYLGYGLTRRIERIRVPEPPGNALPDFDLAFYDHLLRYDRTEQSWYYEALVTEEREAVQQEWRERTIRLLSGPTPHRRSFVLGPFGSPGRTGHVANVERCVAAIRRGDIFQANVCTRLFGPFDGSTAEAWAQAAERLQPARSAYLAMPEGAVLSLSPELFLQRHGRELRTAPIKGTRPRTGVNDEAEARVLAGSTKDSAENIMIVDLMRNDFGRVCRPGTVRVPELLTVEPHPGVWHLVSYVTGQLPDGVSDGALLRATFPPGSVTGAPKLRAIEIIDELEPARRGVYTGAIGFVGPVAGMELNVCIRTLETQGPMAALGVGGGITADSTPIEEWEECLVKAEPLLKAWNARIQFAERDEPHAGQMPDPAEGIFETLLAVDGLPLDVSDHLSRLRRSCWEVYRNQPSADLDHQVRRACLGLSGRHRVRVVIGPGNDHQITTARLPFPGPVPVAGQPGLRGVLRAAPHGLDRHKFVDRDWLDRTEKDTAADEVVLFEDNNGLLLEASRDAVLFVRSGTLIAAPLDGRILPSVTRRVVLDLAEDLGIPTSIQHLHVSRLAELDGAFVSNSLRGIRWLRSIGENRLPPPEGLVTALSDALLARWNLPAAPGRLPLPSPTLPARIAATDAR